MPLTSSTRSHSQPESSTHEGTRSFEAPAAGGRRLHDPRRKRNARQPDAPTRRGSPRPATSVRAVTGDYAKADDNELPRDASTRRPTAELAMVHVTPAPAVRRDEKAPAPEPTPALAAPQAGHDRVRQAWLQGAMAGALVLAVAWLSWLIART